ncbi:MAG: amylo-alpha-1,6-glucosidase [Phycisphaerales bacterium]|nr:amylo-alpha-1,6-glucosidase [Phycisphaerales bacterium]
MDELLEHEDRFYIIASPPPADGRTLVLKHGDTFAIFNSLGDFDNTSHTAQGLFTQGMRFLSRWRTRINGLRPLPLSSTVTDDNTRVMVDLTNPDAADDQGKLVLPRGSLHLLRSVFLWSGSCNQRLTLSNFGPNPVEVTIGQAFGTDFADIFEVRGTPRLQRGDRIEPLLAPSTVVLGYNGLDGIVRRTRIDCSPIPHSLTDSAVEFRVRLEPRNRVDFFVSIFCEPGGQPGPTTYKASLAELKESARAGQVRACQIESSSKPLTQWLGRSYADIDMLLTHTEHGSYPYAGVPWFSAPFGRDGIITAMQLLWIDSTIARGVLQYLAATQAKTDDPQIDAEPGKIIHERRTDEMANLREVPFGKYYGSVDSTPLFIMLAGAYYQATGDLALIETLWPNIELALDWIDRYGDSDSDGFVEYHCRAREGLFNQGWKDSHDAIFHADGTIAHPPIALCEVQGYVYEAQRRAAELARLLGHRQRADQLEQQSDLLKNRFNQSFWLPELGTYALAIDSNKQPCAVRTSNAGQCLFTGIVSEEHAGQLAPSLLDRAMYSGWGIRTLASTEARFNPMAYHNGSIWPHDNALIAAGLARYGFRRQAVCVCNGWFEASTFLELHRLPELCCGFRRRPGKGPTLYPVACSPQAWAAGAVFMMLGACLGLTLNGPRRQVHIHQPRLPRGVDELRINSLRIGAASVDLLFHAERSDVGVLVVRKDGQIDVVVTK